MMNGRKEIEKIMREKAQINAIIKNEVNCISRLFNSVRDYLFTDLNRP